MKANVLLASPDQTLRAGLEDAMGEWCRFRVSTTAGQMSRMLRNKRWSALVVDSKDHLEILHALLHAPAPDVLVLTPKATRLTLALTPDHRFVVVDRQVNRLAEALRALLDPTSSRTISEVRYHKDEDAFFVAFRNGKTYELPRKVIEADDRSGVADVIVEKDRGAFVVNQLSGNTYDVPWDFVLHHQEPAYRYYKGRVDQQEAKSDRARRIGERVRLARQGPGWTLDELAQRTGIQRPNLSRLEAGKHLPSLETLERVAEALGIRLAELVAG